MWKKWVEWTKLKADEEAELDLLMFGNSYQVKKWWGWKRIPVEDVSIEVSEGKPKILIKGKSIAATVISIPRR